MIEKRAFERDRRSFGCIKIMIPALVSVAKPVEDITCDILDISEQGMRISIPQKTYQNVHIRAKDIIHFKFIDDFYMGKSAESDVIAGDARVVYVQEVFDHFELGCYIQSAIYEEYVRHRRSIMEKG